MIRCSHCCVSHDPMWGVRVCNTAGNAGECGIGSCRDDACLDDAVARWCMRWCVECSRGMHAGDARVGSSRVVMARALRRMRAWEMMRASGHATGPSPHSRGGRYNRQIHTVSTQGGCMRHARWRRGYGYLFFDERTRQNGARMDGNETRGESSVIQ